MAEKLSIRVKCHACGNEMVGTARYGKGHYVAEGLDFEFTATGKLRDSKGNTRVKGQVTITCPECTVRNQYDI